MTYSLFGQLGLPESYPKVLEPFTYTMNTSKLIQTKNHIKRENPHRKIKCYKSPNVKKKDDSKVDE